MDKIDEHTIIFLCFHVIVHLFYMKAQKNAYFHIFLLYLLTTVSPVFGAYHSTCIYM